jgi:hypothetical protein
MISLPSSLPICIAFMSQTLLELGHFWTWVTLCITQDDICPFGPTSALGKIRSKTILFSDAPGLDHADSSNEPGTGISWYNQVTNPTLTTLAKVKDIDADSDSLRSVELINRQYPCCLDWPNEPGTGIRLVQPEVINLITPMTLAKVKDTDAGWVGWPNDPGTGISWYNQDGHNLTSPIWPWLRSDTDAQTSGADQESLR